MPRPLAGAFFCAWTPAPQIAAARQRGKLAIPASRLGAWRARAPQRGRGSGWPGVGHCPTFPAATRQPRASQARCDILPQPACASHSHACHARNACNAPRTWPRQARKLAPGALLAIECCWPFHRPATRGPTSGRLPPTQGPPAGASTRGPIHRPWGEKSKNGGNAPSGALLALLARCPSV